jgi:hypothetical protein
MAIDEPTLRRGSIAVADVARAEFAVATDGRAGKALGRALIGLLFVLACLPYEHRALPPRGGS